MSGWGRHRHSLLESVNEKMKMFIDVDIFETKNTMRGFCVRSDRMSSPMYNIIYCCWRMIFCACVGIGMLIFQGPLSALRKWPCAMQLGSWGRSWFLSLREWPT